MTKRAVAQPRAIGEGAQAGAAAIGLDLTLGKGRDVAANKGERPCA